MRSTFRLAILRLDRIPFNEGGLKYVEISPTSDSHNHLEVVYMLIGMDAEHNGKYNRDGG